MHQAKLYVGTLIRSNFENEHFETTWKYANKWSKPVGDDAKNQFQLLLKLIEDNVNDPFQHGKK